MTPPTLHVFIPELFRPLALWQQDFAFKPAPSSLLTILAGVAPHSLSVQGLERTLWQVVDGSGQESLPWASLRYALEVEIAPPSIPLSVPLLCADPVHLQTGRDRITLSPERPNLQPAELAALVATLNQHLAQDGWFLSAPHPQRWYLHALHTPRYPLPRTTPPSEVGQASIFKTLPVDATQYWQRLSSELQMLLHTHPVNQQRLEQGLAPVNALWWWGEGTEPVLPLSASSVQRVVAGGLTGQVLAHALAIPWQAQLDPSPLEQLLILDTLRVPTWHDDYGGWQAALLALEEPYLKPVVQALQRGQAVQVYDCAGQYWLGQLPPRWQFWRRSSANWSDFKDCY